jgi:hypothetical protein
METFFRLEIRANLSSSFGSSSPEVMVLKGEKSKGF